MRVQIIALIEVNPKIYEQWGMGRITLGLLLNESKVIEEKAEQVVGSGEDAERNVPNISVAREIAKMYEKAPCFAELLGESDPNNPCTCPSCGLTAIRLALGDKS